MPPTAPRFPATSLMIAAALLACCEAGADRTSNVEVVQPQVGVASYYGREFAGKKTASGEPFDPRAMTAASPSLPLGTTARVTNTVTGRSVAVEINDRGPYTKSRILDVSAAAARQLGMKESGVAQVAIQPLAAQTEPPAEN
jgi:rare lipoprotein A